MFHALEVDNRVAGVDDRVVSVNNSVEGRVGRMTSVSEKEWVLAVARLTGAQSSSICRQENMFNSGTTNSRLKACVMSLVLKLLLAVTVPAQSSSQGVDF